MVADQSGAWSRRSFLQALGIASAGSVLAACAPAGTNQPTGGAAPADSPPRAGGSIRIDVLGDPLALDPLRFNGLSIQRIYRNVHNQLLKWNDDGTISPDLAAAMPTVSPDGLTYTFKLRRDVRFHDGKQFDSADVKFSYDQILVPNSPSFWAVGLSRVVATEAPDPETFIVRIREPFTYQMGKFAMAPIVSSAIPYVSNETYATRLMGTGPYRFVEWQRGVQIVLEKNPNYFERNIPLLDRLVFRTVPENAARITNLRTNTTQIVVEMPPNLVEQARGFGAVIGVARSGGIRQMMYPNFAEGRPTRDVNFRQAVAWALDRQGIIDQVFPGIAVPAGSYLSDGTVYHDPALGGRFFNNGRPDLQRARDFLQRAGGPPNRELVFVVENTPDQVDMATIIQQNLRAIGLNVRLSPEDVASYFPKFPFGDYDFLMFRSPTTTAVGFDPDYVFAGLFSTSPSNLNRFVDPEMDRLLNVALQAPAGPQAQAAWRAVSERDLQTLGQIQVVTLKNTEAISRNLRGYEVSGLPYMPSLPRAGLA